MSFIATRPLSLQQVVTAVNQIRDFIQSRIKLTTSDEGLAYLRAQTHHGTFDLLINAVDTSSVRGFTQNATFRLATELGVPAVIRLQIITPNKDRSLVTHTEYLLVRAGDDPVLLFCNYMRKLQDENTPTIGPIPLALTATKSPLVVSVHECQNGD